MHCATLTAAAVVAAVGVAVAQQDVYVWAGGSTRFDNPSNWDDGVSPLNASNLPERTMVGSGQPLVTAIASNSAFDVGASLNLGLNARIVFTGAPGTVLVFTADVSARNGVANFDPVPAQSADVRAPRFDMTCNLNWRNNGDIPLAAPCVDTTVQFPLAEGPFTASTFGSSLAVDRLVGAAPNGTWVASVTSCNDATDSASSQFSLGDSTYVLLPQCAAQVRFGAAAQTAPCANRVSVGLSQNCGQSITFPAVTMATGRPVAGTYTLIWAGPYAGTVLQQSEASLTNVTALVGLSRSPDGSSYLVGNVSVDATTGVATRNRAYNSGASSSGESGVFDGHNLTILVAVIAVLVIVVVAALVHRGRQTGGGGSGGGGKDMGARSGSPREASFDNPMYDNQQGKPTGTGHPMLELVPGGDDMLYAAAAASDRGSAHFSHGSPDDDDEWGGDEFGFDSYGQPSDEYMRMDDESIGGFGSDVDGSVLDVAQGGFADIDDESNYDLQMSPG